MKKILLKIILLNSITSQIINKKNPLTIPNSKNLQGEEQDCLPSNIHITLGDYFADRSSPIMYRIGFMQKSQTCQNEIILKINFEDEKSKTFRPKNKRDYTYKGTAYDQKIDYSRTFKFFDLSELENNSEFSYSIFSNDKLVKGPFYFKTKILDQDENNFNIKSFGDHDLENGTEIVDYLEEIDFDLLILLGDYSYDLENDNGNHGDAYFNYLEKIFTKAPVILVPGNHESLDNSRFLTTRFIFPGTKNPDDNNCFFFRIKNNLFIGYNSDYYMSNISSQIQILKTLEEYFEKTQKKVKNKILINHRPLLCSSYQKKISSLECQLSIYYNKELNDLLLENELDLIISGHIHNYERLKRMDNYTPNKGFTQIIVGTGGNSKRFENFEKFDIDFLESQVQKKIGFLSLDFSQRVRGRFFEAVSGDIYDDFVVNQVHVDGGGFYLFFKITAFFVFVTFVGFLGVFFYGRFREDREVSGFIESERLEDFLADGHVVEDLDSEGGVGGEDEKKGLKEEVVVEEKA